MASLRSTGKQRVPDGSAVFSGGENKKNVQVGDLHHKFCKYKLVDIVDLVDLV